MKNPWETGAVYGGVRVAHTCAEDRIGCVKKTVNAKKLREMIKWPNTQETVRLAAERRLRKISVKEREMAVNKQKKRKYLWTYL